MSDEKKKSASRPSPNRSIGAAIKAAVNIVKKDDIATDPARPSAKAAELVEVAGSQHVSTNAPAAILALMGGLVRLDGKVKWETRLVRTKGEHKIHAIFARAESAQALSQLLNHRGNFLTSDDVIAEF